MAGKRSERRATARARNKRVLVGASLTIAVVAVLALALVRVGGPSAEKRRVASGKSATAAVEAELPQVPQVSAAASPTARVPVEMPDVRGKPLSEAQALLTAAGFPVLLQGDTSSRGGREAVVVAQAPAPRAKVSRGEKVTLTSEGADSPRAKHRVVVLDPGHQVRADLTPEPIGPGARESKERVTAGSVGVSTGRSECEVSLELALRVRARLQEAGVEVVLTRTTNSAALSNAQRAEIANRAGADLFVRLHADAVEEAAVRGVSVLYPAGNRWVTGIAADSRRAADTVRTSAVRTSGAPDRGSAARADLAGFNYCRVPAILVEAGCLSNVEDDRLLGTAAYQDKLADGIVAGVLAYFGR